MTPEDKARLAPPGAVGEMTARQLVVADHVMALANVLEAMLPQGPYLTAALGALGACADWGYTGAVSPDAPVSYLPADHDVAAGHPGPADPVPEVSIDLWQLGVQTADLNPFSRLTALVLATYADHTGRIAPETQPTLPDLLRRTGLVMPHLHAALTQLDRHHWIARERTSVGSTHLTRYELTMPGPNPR